ncbi:homocysteine S-methyltransferase family protein [uncultured Ruegeria sp.]|uniref:homocysteine S-methyltransferase family protein n=1 Tax=uncultured Ruegeria sp. TaxID=259304 RepID=UPI00262712A0|nr:homocysteine S-methyltransferase family protein [uncultured Ruegeria sp.]
MNYFAKPKGIEPVDEAANAARIQSLLTTTRPFLSDGGFETSLFFIDGFEAPEFAAILLMNDPEARRAMSAYFDRFLAQAEATRTGFILDTATWRGCIEWAPRLGITTSDMICLSRDAVTFAKGIRTKWESRVSPILLNGVVGPAGDGYAPEMKLDSALAQSLHTPQIDAFAEEGVDTVSAITMTHVGEAVGIARASFLAGLPVVVSFTVETDGRLPSGETLREAIYQTDLETAGAPIYYMVNCAHPDHFRDAIRSEEPWINRIRGVRANASRLSHAELDEAEELDDGNPEEFGQLHGELARMLPNLAVLGGCCGTDRRHIEHACQALGMGETEGERDVG